MIAPLDIALRTAAVLAALLLATLLFTTSKRRPAALPGGFFCLAVAAFFMTSIPGGSKSLGAVGYALTALCVTKAAWFWLFARELFADEARIGARHGAVVGAVAIIGAWQQTMFLPAFREGAASAAEIVAGFGFEGALLVLVILGLYEAGRDFATDLVERRRRLRVGFMVAAGVYLAVTVGVQSVNLALDVSTPLFATRANMLLVVAGCLLAAALIVQPRRDSWLDPVRRDTTVALNANEAAVLTRLERALELDRVHLEEGLTIGRLAERLGAGEHVLRLVINRAMGYRNFNDFLHAYRIREACAKLACPEEARQPVLSIAMGVGYGSIGAFNRAFKDRIGMTPTAYRRSSASEAPQLH
jgi:AraC-like DNA-binding protein